MQEQLQQLMTNHAALLDNLRNLAQQFDEAAKLAVTIGHQINRLSTLVDDSKTEPAPAAPRTGGHFHEVGSCYCDRWPPDATLREYIADAGGAVSVLDCMQSFELATHEQTITMLGEAVARKAIESTTDELGHVWYQLAIVNVPPSSEVRPVASIQLGAEQSGPAAVESVPSPPSGVRKKNEFTAREWRNSLHFSQLMKQPCFSEWPFAVQRAKGDEFVEAIERLSPELRMNRWGSRFKSFHGVS